MLFIVRAHTSWPLPSLQETLSHQIYAMQPPKFASKLPQLIALLQQITPSCNKCPPLLKISTRLITTRRNLRKLTLLSETEKGSFEEEYNENVSPFQIYLIFFLLSAYFESQIFCTRPWHSLVWYFNAFKVAGCLRVCVCVHGRMIFRVALMQILSQPASPSNIQPNSSHWILKTLCTAGKLRSHIYVFCQWKHMHFKTKKREVKIQSQCQSCPGPCSERNWVS